MHVSTVKGKQGLQIFTNVGVDIVGHEPSLFLLLCMAMQGGWVGEERERAPAKFLYPTSTLSSFSSY